MWKTCNQTIQYSEKQIVLHGACVTGAPSVSFRHGPFSQEWLFSMVKNAFESMASPSARQERLRKVNAPCKQEPWTDIPQSASRHQQWLFEFHAFTSSRCYRLRTEQIGRRSKKLPWLHCWRTRYYELPTSTTPRWSNYQNALIDNSTHIWGLTYSLTIWHNVATNAKLRSICR